MKAYTQAWADNIYAPTRMTKIRINFPFVDPDAKEVAKPILYPTSAPIGHVDQILDDNPVIVGKIAQFAPDYWKLDGSFILPLTDTETDSQYGWWTDAISGTDKSFPANFTFRYFFEAPVTVPGFTIVFDTATDTYPVDFDIVGYDEDMNVIRRLEIRGNDTASFSIDNGIVAMKYVDFITYSLNRQEARLRVIEVDFGINLLFDSDNTFNCTLIVECDPQSEALPGNELTFTARNDGRYDYTHPESYAKYLQRRQQFEYTHMLYNWETGEQLASVDMGTYYLTKWSVSDHEVEFVCTLDYSALEEYPFRRYSLIDRLTAGQLLERIFDDVGWSDYDIAAELYNSPMMVPYTGDVTSKEALRLVAALCGAVVEKLPTGTIRIRKLDFSNPTLVDTLDYNNLLDRPVAEVTEYYNAISLKVTSAVAKDTPQDAPIVLFTGQGSTEQQTVVVPFDYILFDTAPTSTISGGTLISEQIYANYAFLTVQASGVWTYQITGKTVDFNTSTDLVVYAPWFQTGEQLKTYPLDIPMIIQGDTYAALQPYCTDARFALLGYRLGVNVRWRQNPAHDIGDYLNIQLDRTGNDVPVYMRKHVLDYKGGALSGNSVGLSPGIELEVST